MCFYSNLQFHIYWYTYSHKLLHALLHRCEKKNTQIANRLHCSYKACHLRVMLIVQLSDAVVYVLVV